MGGSISSPNFEHTINKKDFPLVKKYKDRRFGEVSEVRNKKTGKSVLMKEIEIKKANNSQDILHAFIKRISLSHPHLVPIYGTAGMDTFDNILASNERIYVYFEYLQNDLFQALDNRRKPFGNGSRVGKFEIKTSLQLFEESELYGIMIQLVNVLEYLQRNGISHGDVRPEACFISDEGIIKLVDKWCMNEELTCEPGRTRVYPSPALFCETRSSGEEASFKEDVFGLGMTLLECATLSKSGELYDWKERRFDMEVFMERLKDVKKRYSESLFNILLEMLIFDEEQRLDFVELKARLNGDGKSKNPEKINVPLEERLKTNHCSSNIQNSFSHKPVPMPKNFQLTLKEIPREEDFNSVREGHENINPKQITESPNLSHLKRYSLRKDQTSQNLFKRPLEDEKKVNVHQRIKSIDMNFRPNNIEPSISRRESRTNPMTASHAFESKRLLGEVERLGKKYNLGNSLVHKEWENNTSRIAQKEPMQERNENHLVHREKISSHNQERYTIEEDSQRFKKELKHSNSRVLTPVNHEVSVSSSGYCNPFIQSQTPQSRPNNLKASIEISKDSNGRIRMNNPFLQQQENHSLNRQNSLNNFQLNSTRSLESSKSVMNLRNNPNDDLLKTSHSHLVENILSRILDQSGLKSSTISSTNTNSLTASSINLSSSLRPKAWESNLRATPSSTNLLTQSQASSRGNESRWGNSSPYDSKFFKETSLAKSKVLMENKDHSKESARQEGKSDNEFFGNLRIKMKRTSSTFYGAEPGKLYQGY